MARDVMILMQSILYLLRGPLEEVGLEIATSRDQKSLDFRALPSPCPRNGFAHMKSITYGAV
jgi:hypothetical protein